MLETDVVVVGAGPVGLTTSIALSQHGVEHVVVERHPGTSVAPKARGINGRESQRGPGLFSCLAGPLHLCFSGLRTNP